MKTKAIIQSVVARCPQCAITIDNVTADSMVYCRRCRKWCRVENNSQSERITTSQPVVRRRLRRPRCH